ncbi:SIS domain-containing protein [Halobacillus litoralis]|uniref:SIS domain-containing protein n=1 Tax=Halobacillus litoralis TaxID=45668 RepID=UPI00249021B0|nr:SIS domain-containing protein [Halobacillus litoralis]
MSYLSKITQHLKRLDEHSGVHPISRQVAGRLNDGGIIHLFGCGHSSLLAQDVYYRAGGLVPVRPILIEPLMLHQGAYQSTLNERTAGFVYPYLAKEDIREEDVVIVLSTSGRNPAPIDVALYGKAQGAMVISVQSLEYSATQVSKHPSQKRLEAVVDFVMDTKVPVGDAIEVRKGLETHFSPLSSVVGTALLHDLMTKVIEAFWEDGIDAPVFKSGNVDGADEHNRQMMDLYKDRIAF